MPEDIKPPSGLKKNQTKILLGVGVAGAGYLYYRNRQANAAAAAAVPAAGSTTDTGLGVPTDTGPGTYGTQYSAASSSTVGTVSTNQDWYNTALTAVEDAGYDSATAATALSAYLASQPLTAAQQTIVRIGLAAAGNPPVGSFSIITPATPIPPPNNNRPVDWPQVGGPRIPQRTTHTITIVWDPVNVNGQPPPNGYTVRALDSGGRQIAIGQTTGNAWQFTGLQPVTRYDLQVWTNGMSATNKHAAIFASTTK